MFQKPFNFNGLFITMQWKSVSDIDKYCKRFNFLPVNESIGVTMNYGLIKSDYACNMRVEWLHNNKAVTFNSAPSLYFNSR